MDLLKSDHSPLTADLLSGSDLPGGPISRIATRFLANTPVPSTRETYGREVAHFIRWCGSDRQMAEVSLDDLLRYKLMLESRHSSPTVMKKVAAIKSLFAFARKLGAFAENQKKELRIASSDNPCSTPISTSKPPACFGWIQR